MNVFGQSAAQCAKGFVFRFALLQLSRFFSLIRVVIIFKGWRIDFRQRFCNGFIHLKIKQFMFFLQLRLKCRIFGKLHGQQV